jgi:hypothetical protein
LWARADADGSGELTCAEWEICLYRIELEFWPDPDETTIAKVVEELDAAADKWHQASGNWFKVFRIFDTDNSYSVDFDEMLAMIRRPLPCLTISSNRVSDSALRCFWKALDVDKSGHVTVQEFMVFMRRRSGKFYRKESKPQRVPYNQILPDQARLLCDMLMPMTYDTFVQAYDDWQRPFFGTIAEMDWFRFVRTFVKISDSQISDDTLYNAWRLADPGGYGEVTAEAILGIAARLQPANYSSYEMDDSLVVEYASS